MQPLRDKAKQDKTPLPKIIEQYVIIIPRWDDLPTSCTQWQIMAIRVRVCIKINVMIHNKNDDYALANVVSLTSCLIKQTKILNIYLQLFPISTRLRQKSNFKLGTM